MKSSSTRVLVGGFVCVSVVLGFAQGTIVWPEDNMRWPTATPESQGLSSERLAEVPQIMKQTVGNVGTGIVIRNGYDVWHYGDPYGRATGWASCTRSVLLSAFAMQIKEGLVGGGQQCVERPVNEINTVTAQKFSSDVLLKHLLSNTACSSPPGSGWKYACEYVQLRNIVSELDGEDLPGKRIDRIGELLGASTWEHFLSKSHPSNPFVNLKVNAADAARWGYWWLNKGEWRGKQLVDSWFVERSLELMPSPTGGFAHHNEGWKIHLNTHHTWGDSVPSDAFAALGADTRLIFVAPSLNLVYARFGPQDGFGWSDDEYGDRVLGLGPYVQPIVRAVVDSTSIPSSRTTPKFICADRISGTVGIPLGFRVKYDTTGCWCRPTVRYEKKPMWVNTMNDSLFGMPTRATEETVEVVLEVEKQPQDTLVLIIQVKAGAQVLALPNVGLELDLAVCGSELIVQGRASCKYRISVHDVNGRIVWQYQNDQEGAQRIHRIPQQRCGLYVVSIDTGARRVIQKFFLVK